MKPSKNRVLDLSTTLSRTPDASTSGPLAAADFDAFDRRLLASAFALGERYAKVIKGTHGYWVAMVSKDDPKDLIDRSAHRHAAIVRIDKIAGLSRPEGSGQAALTGIDSKSPEPWQVRCDPIGKMELGLII